MLELEDKDFKITMINILKNLLEEIEQLTKRWRIFTKKRKHEKNYSLTLCDFVSFKFWQWEDVFEIEKKNDFKNKFPNVFM